jgi:hypothetical protein
MRGGDKVAALVTTQCEGKVSTWSAGDAWDLHMSRHGARAPPSTVR